MATYQRPDALTTRLINPPVERLYNNVTMLAAQPLRLEFCL